MMRSPEYPPTFALVRPDESRHQMGRAMRHQGFVVDCSAGTRNATRLFLKSESLSESVSVMFKFCQAMAYAINKEDIDKDGERAYAVVRLLPFGRWKAFFVD